MSLDNVLAIAAVAKDLATLLILGLIISVALVVASSALIEWAVLSRAPLLVWAGAALLGWVAGDMLVSDPWLLGTSAQSSSSASNSLPPRSARSSCVALGYVLSRRRRRHKTQEQEA